MARWVRLFRNACWDGNNDQLMEMEMLNALNLLEEALNEDGTPEGPSITLEMLPNTLDGPGPSMLPTSLRGPTNNMYLESVRSWNTPTQTAERHHSAGLEKEWKICIV